MIFNSKTLKNPLFLDILFDIPGNKMLSAKSIRNAYKKISKERIFAILAEEKGQ